jgi:hypothetical protein
MRSVVTTLLVVAVVVFLIYQYDPTFFGLMRGAEGFYDAGNMGAQMPTNTGGDRSAAPVGPGSVNGPTNMGQNLGAHNVSQSNPAMNGMKPTNHGESEGFADLNTYEGPANFGTAEGPAGCYPRDQLTPSELLPKDMNSIWAQQNPLGTGSLKGKNFLSAGALVGVNTVGQSLRNANLQLRSEPPNPQMPVSIFNQSTITPDISHRPLEIGA